MPLSLKHTKQSDKSDGQDDLLLQPSHWNAEHTFTSPAKRLVGNATDSDGPVTDVKIGGNLELDEATGTLDLAGDLVNGDLVVSDEIEGFPNARVLTDTPSVTWDDTVAKQIKADVADNGVTLAKLEDGTEAQILYYGVSGAPIRLDPGIKGSVLVSGVASAVGPPVVAFEAPSWGFAGAPHAVLRDKKGNGVQGGGLTSGDWRDRILNDELYDIFEFVTLKDATTTNTLFTLEAGTYIVEWSAPAYSVTQHQSRLWNNTDNVLIESGSAEVSGTTQNRSLGIAKFTIAADKELKIQHRGDVTKATDGFGSAANYNGMSEIYTIMKIWRVA